MIRLEAFGESGAMAKVAELLEGAEGVSHVMVAAAAREGHSLIIAVVRPARVDPLLATLEEGGLAASELTLTRLEVVGRGEQPEASLIWEDVLGAAWVNSRPVARYLAFMLVAGVIGCYGVVDVNGILIVGAMAVSPDLLPITAIGVALVGHRSQLAWRALLTLVVGLGIAVLASATATVAQDALGLIPKDFSFDARLLANLTTVNDETFVVALVAGVAGMLALETRASAGVGVAISVTTIPAAAYLGVAIGLGESGRALGALGVLCANVLMLVVGASGTLAIQRKLKMRRALRVDGSSRSPVRGDAGAGPSH